MPLVEKYWGGWKAGSAGIRARSPRSRRPTARSTCTCRGRATRCRGSRSAFPARPSTRRARTRRRWRSWPRCTSARRPSCTRSSSSPNRRSTQLDVDVPAERRSVALHGPRAREEAGGRRRTCATRSWRRSRRARTTLVAGRAAGGREVVQPIRVRADARQHRAHRGRRVALTRRTGARTTPSTTYYRTLDSLTPADLQIGRAEVLHRRGPDRDDAREGRRCRRHRAHAVARRR